MGCKGAFEQITYKNQSLLKQSYFISFAHNNFVLIAGDRNKKMISFNTETEEVEQTQIQLQEKDIFSYIHDGFKVDNEMYLVGIDHIHMVDLVSN